MSELEQEHRFSGSRHHPSRSFLASACQASAEAPEVRPQPCDELFYFRGADADKIPDPEQQPATDFPPSHDALWPSLRGPSSPPTMEEGEANGVFHANIAQGLLRNGGGSGGDSVSRATSPGLGFSTSEHDLEREKRYRPRTYPYFKLLPYSVEEEAERNNALEEILKQLYIAVKAEDIAPGAVHWTRELRGWLNLKFEITRALRVKLVKLYYMLCLAPGIDSAAADRFESMFRTLTK